MTPIIIEKKLFGWRVIDKSPAITHCVVAVAPHTSNWDFVIGNIACRLLDRRMHFLMKEDWFKGPLDPIFRRMGGIPVNRASAHGLTEELAQQFQNEKDFTLVITPEGTRSPNPNWKTGFYHIALAAGVPLLLASLDYKHKEICVSEPFNISGNIDTDINKIKEYFYQYKGKKENNFAI